MDCFGNREYHRRQPIYPHGERDALCHLEHGLYRFLRPQRREREHSAAANLYTGRYGYRLEQRRRLEQTGERFWRMGGFGDRQHPYRQPLYPDGECDALCHLEPGLHRFLRPQRGNREHPAAANLYTRRYSYRLEQRRRLEQTRERFWRMGGFGDRQHSPQQPLYPDGECDALCHLEPGLYRFLRPQRGNREHSAAANLYPRRYSYRLEQRRRLEQTGERFWRMGGFGDRQHSPQQPLYPDGECDALCHLEPGLYRFLRPQRGEREHSDTANLYPRRYSYRLEQRRRLE